MTRHEESAMPGVPDGLRALAPAQLAADHDAARIVARLTRKGSVESEPVRVAAFNSYI
jgi:hypothetical protein